MSPSFVGYRIWSFGEEGLLLSVPGVSPPLSGIRHRTREFVKRAT